MKLGIKLLVIKPSLAISHFFNVILIVVMLNVIILSVVAPLMRQDITYPYEIFYSIGPRRNQHYAIKENRMKLVTNGSSLISPSVCCTTKLFTVVNTDTVYDYEYTSIIDIYFYEYFH
jgi:hypothetical protein